MKRVTDSMASVSSSGHLAHKRFGQLTYLERVADSHGISMFFHGLGLDERDYQEYLETHDTHGIAVSLAGYAPGHPDPLPPVPASRHVEMVADLVEQVSRKNPDKRIDLVGFSLGADLVLQLAELWTAEPGRRRPPVSGVLLLDPNVNQSTMTISRLFASADRRDPTPALKELVGLAQDREVLRSLCSYVIKISSKDFGQVHRLANDMIRYWEPVGYDQFGARVARVAEIADVVNIVLSADYGKHLPGMKNAVRRYHSHATDVSLNITELDHFELIENEFLSRELKEIG
ncbi:alpha/beta fold hydrolase [Streptomyces sp. GESEQ-35]|uniref:alpha/beta fold hydrolase n=1 Tax=Streptomyces sp. GESEQ-35 TaxID=2812657 RepID=UPI001B31B560|nr:alpha/beta fold hydrolase [Streptomyces sp. GESEQ-35]